MISQAVDMYMTPAGMLLFKTSEAAASVVMGVEYRGLRVWPPEKDLYDQRADEQFTTALGTYLSSLSRINRVTGYD